MAPDGLKVGDIFEDYGIKHIITKVLTEGPARYEAKVYEGPEKEVKEEVKEVKEKAVEEKTEAKPKTTRKKTTAKK